MEVPPSSGSDDSGDITEPESPIANSPFRLICHGTSPPILPILPILPLPFPLFYTSFLFSHVQYVYMSQSILSHHWIFSLFRFILLQFSILESMSFFHYPFLKLPSSLWRCSDIFGSLESSVADPERFDADPDLAFRADVDQEPDLDPKFV